MNRPNDQLQLCTRGQVISQNRDDTETLRVSRCRRDQDAGVTVSRRNRNIRKNASRPSRDRDYNRHCLYSIRNHKRLKTFNISYIVCSKFDDKSLSAASYSNLRHTNDTITESDSVWKTQDTEATAGPCGLWILSISIRCQFTISKIQQQTCHCRKLYRRMKP